MSMSTSDAQKTSAAPLTEPLAFVPHAELYELQASPHLWNVNAVSVGERSTVISGWCLPFHGRLNETELTVNGEPYALQPLKPSVPYAELYPWHPNAAWSPFELEIMHWVQDLRKAPEISMLPRSTRTGQPASYSLDVLTADLEFAIPPADIAARIGVSNLADYVILGRSIYRGFEHALARTFKSGFGDYGTVLDWGCGSGRVARHLVAQKAPGQTIIGVDIDAYAVAWANERFGPHFRACATQPPLEMPTGSVDLFCAYSVFTHLAADDLKSWSAEMARVVKPDGIAMFTVLSDGAMVALHPYREHSFLESWNSTGIFDSMANTQLDTLDIAKNYYRNVWLKRAYIEAAIGHAFDVVEHIQGFHFYQDLVVARRR